MNTEQILMCVVALILGMLLANMLKSVCGCKNLIEGQGACSNDNLQYDDHGQAVQCGVCVAAELSPECQQCYLEGRVEDNCHASLHTDCRHETIIERHCLGS